MKNAPIIGACVLLAFGVILAVMPAHKPSPAARAGFEQAERGHPPQLEQAVKAIHEARDKPDFTAEVLLSIVHRFYRVLLGGPSAVNATTEWSKLSGSLFRVYGFAVDDASSAASKNAERSQSFKKAVADQIMRDAHIHMIARDGDRIFVDAEAAFGAEYLAERCAAFKSYGMRCAAWDDAAVADAIAELQADHAASTEAAGGELAGVGAAARPQLFLIGRTSRLNTHGMWPEERNAQPHEQKPLHGVPHLILLPAGEEQMRMQQQQYEQAMKAQQAAAAKQQGTGAPDATADQDAKDKDDGDEEEIDSEDK